MGSMSGKVAIVTGASTLIGQGVVRALNSEGAKVVMADIAIEDGKALASELGEGVTFVETDVTDDGALDALIAASVDAYGGIDYLVNLASTYMDEGVNSSRQVWQDSLNINLISGQVLASKVAPEMEKRGGGRSSTRFDLGQGRAARSDDVFGSKGRHHRDHAKRCDAITADEYPCELDQPWLDLVEHHEDGHQ